MVYEQPKSSISKYLASLQPVSGRDEKPKQKDHIFLSYGSPSPDLFPIEEFKQASVEILNNRGEDALQYAGGEGPTLVKNWIKEQGKRRHIHIQEEEILITAGAAQGIDFTTRLLVNPGDEVWVEQPTYFFALQSFQLAGANIQMIPMDNQGIKVDYLKEKLEYHVKFNKPIPKLLYCMPNYHNPTGKTLAPNRRKELAKLAQLYDFFIVEDDAYAELGFEQRYLPAIYSYAPERVLYLGTFSKIIAPGVRIGWVAASEEFINKMKLLMLGPQTSPIVQEILGRLLVNYSFEEQVNRLITCYQEKRDIMISAIYANFGDSVYFEIPKGGFFIWLQFQQEIEVDKLFRIAFDKGVSIVQGSSFYKNQIKNSSVRLCYSFCNKEQIEQGIKLLAESYFSLIGKQETP